MKTMFRVLIVVCMGRRRTTGNRRSFQSNHAGFGSVATPASEVVRNVKFAL